jgi:tyrosinase
MNRRDFLESGVKLALGSMAIGIADEVQTRAQQSVRRSINGLSSADPIVKTYAKAVDLMKKLPQNDPRNWTQQANIHNNFCPHQNWWFLPWHRPYLFYFESICRDLLQDSTFSLPYWDWTRYPKIPDPFLETTSPLFDSHRDDGVKLGDEIVGPKVISGIVGSGSLLDLFSSPTTTDDQRQTAAFGSLEGTPHNGVHGTIQGDMGTYMSPLDPIFWLHHCNVDRIWASWAKGSNNLAPTASLWTNHALARFYDPLSKQQVSPKAGDTLDAAKYRAIYDRYESQVGPSLRPGTSSLRSVMLGVEGQALNAADIKQVDGGRLAGREVALGTAQQFRLPVSSEFSSLVSKHSTLLADAAPPAEAYVQIEKIPQPTVSSTALRIFLNCKNPSLETPLDDPTYVSTVAFFGGGHDHDTQPDTTFTINVTDALSRVLRAGIYSAGAPIDVALLPVDLTSPHRIASAAVVKPSGIRLVGLAAI